MREWTEFAKLWLQGVACVLLVDPVRHRLHNSITSALDGKPRVNTTWMRILSAAEKQREFGCDWEPLRDMLDSLKDIVVAEEVVVA